MAAYRQRRSVMAGEKQLHVAAAANIAGSSNNTAAIEIKGGISENSGGR